MTDLVDWLAALGLGKYARAFAEHEIDFDLLPVMTEADLRELGLPIGPRRRLLGALAGLRGEPEPRRDKTEPRGEAERRQLTVMFVDLAQSTRLALRIDPEAMRDVLHAFHAAVTGKIARSGYVAKFMGDGVLAYFGWPQAHEDDARRAVAAALSIVEAVAGLNSPTGETLACRVGIATGTVVVGDLIGEGTAREHAVVGPTPNLAARLQEAAGPGEIMIADTTRRLLGPGFVVEPVGARMLKGHEEAVPLFRALRRESRQVRSFAAGLAALRPLVGREAESSALRRAWAQAKSGRCQTVLLTGEAGIGKSRLVQAIAEEAAQGLLFQCWSLHSDNPFWPVVQQLPSSAALVERVTGPVERRDTDQFRREIVAAMAAQVLAALHDEPALVVCEDAQWADRATLDLLRHLAAAEAPLLLLVTSRPEGEPRFGAAASLQRIVLPRLDDRAAGALLASVTGPHQLAIRIRTEILVRSDGVPLFIEEISKAVLEAGPAGKLVPVPATLQDSLIARLDVSPSVKAVAQIASCIGRDFAEKLLSQVADIAQTELQEGLAGLLGGGLLLPTSPGRFRFKHALVCDIAYDSLLTPRRQKLHWRIAEAIEAMPGAAAEREPETLAHHWFAADQKKRAELYWLRARHRVTHWQEQLDALADYLEGGAAEVIPFPVGSGRHWQP